MTHLDQMIADSLAQSPDTVVHQLASEVVRLRGWSADGGRLFHKNCRSCICWNGDMCELISHICENGEQWLPSANFVAAHPEVAALVDFAEQMRASASQFSAALDAVQKEIADLKRGGVVVPEPDEFDLRAIVARAGVMDEPGVDQCIARATIEWVRSKSRTIPADRELMRLVDELIRWHGLRPLDKRPDHAAVLVGAIKALRAQFAQELAP